MLKPNLSKRNIVVLTMFFFISATHAGGFHCPPLTTIQASVNYISYRAQGTNGVYSIRSDAFSSVNHLWAVYVDDIHTSSIIEAINIAEWKVKSVMMFIRGDRVTKTCYYSPNNVRAIIVK